MAKDRSMYRSAMGKTMDIDSLRIANEELIAVGNMRVNARGDELGPGGIIMRTREEVMADESPVSAPTVTHAEPQNPNVPVNSPRKETPKTPVEEAMMQPAVPVEFPDDIGDDEDVLMREDPVPQPIPDPNPLPTGAIDPALEAEEIAENIEPEPAPPVRGSLAAAVAGEVSVNQEAMPKPKKSGGPRRVNG